jgi:RNA polymerase-binding transcription factor DksA
MTIISVERVTDDTTTCRRCSQPIERERRAALLAGTGLVHLRCLLDDEDNDDGPWHD